MKTQTINYTFFSRKNLKKLAEFQSIECISIYIPTSRTGLEVDEKQGQLNLKNALKNIRHNLSTNYKRTDNEIEAYLKPVESLLEDVHFWRNQSDGLAIFLHKKGMEYYSLPLKFEFKTYISNHFYLLPLFPFFNGDGLFYLLKLSQDNVSLFEANRHTLTSIFIKDLVPEDVAIPDKDKSLQGKVVNSGRNESVIFHGHGAGKDDPYKQVKKFFNEVDKGVTTLINEGGEPLVLACQDHYFPLYKDTCTYFNLYPDFVNGNPEAEDDADLHEKAWGLVADTFQEQKKTKIEQLQDLQNSDQVRTELERIIPEAVEGRVDTLFINESVELYGFYDIEKRQVVVEEAQSVANAELINLAAIKTFLQGGKIYIANSDDMPLEGFEMNALLRY